MTPAVKNMIRESKSHLISGVIASGNEDDMISMDESIFNLYKDGRITKETALAYSDNFEQMQRRLK